MADISSVLPGLVGAIVLGTLVWGQLTKPSPAPVPVRSKRPRRR